MREMISVVAPAPQASQVISSALSCRMAQRMARPIHKINKQAAVQG